MPDICCCFQNFTKCLLHLKKWLISLPLASYPKFTTWLIPSVVGASDRLSSAASLASTAEFLYLGLTGATVQLLPQAVRSLKWRGVRHRVIRNSQSNEGVNTQLTVVWGNAPRVLETKGNTMRTDTCVGCLDQISSFNCGGISTRTGRK